MASQLDMMVIRQLWDRAMAEDGADRDITSMVSIDAEQAGRARLNAKTAGVFAGVAILDTLRAAQPELVVNAEVKDGASLTPGTPIATLQGSVRELLAIERTLLNFLQRLCGVATLTRRYVDAVAGTVAKIYDTRKTIPGWRTLDKYGVRCGGGYNHRIGLHDAILIKDNHLAGVPTERLASHLFAMLNEAASLSPPPAFVEVEVDTLEQLDEVLKVVGIDVILLDNFTPEQMREAIRRRTAAGIDGSVQFEASGGIVLEGVHEIASTGVERISVGAITHSATALDINMEILAD